MKSTWRTITALMFAALALTFVGQAWASNPADPTADFRYSGDFAKVAWDGGPWFLLGIKEVGNRTSVLAFNWNGNDSASKLYELGVTKQFEANGTLEVGLFADAWHEGEDRVGGMLDWTNGRVGIGTVLSFGTDNPNKVALRYNAGKATLNLAYAETGAAIPNYGVGYTLANKTRLELAYGSGTWYFRACQPHGKYFPELRTKFSGNETVIGFGLGFAG